jgi:hypothetical protein
MKHPIIPILEQARALRREGHPKEAVSLLAGMEAPCDAPHEALRFHEETQQALLEWAETATQPGDPLRTKLFFRAQESFYRAVYINPIAGAPYITQSKFWWLLGDPAMGRRLLRSIQQVSPHVALAEALEAFPATAAERPPAETAPTLEAVPRGFRVLVLGIPGYDPGMDVLYDGLCEVIGAENVEEFPWKPMLHGEAMEEAEGYPTPCNRPGTPRGLSWVCEALRAGRFQAVLYADLIQSQPREEVRAIVAAANASHTPLCVVDGWDDAADNQAIILDRLGLSRVPVYFKREMLRCHDYGPNVFPLPLSYADARFPTQPARTRSRLLFWAGNRYYGLRRLYLEVLEAALGAFLDARLAQESYVRALGNSLIGLSCFGFGYDTVRYYEVPAHGAMLLAERPPIRIPHDFVDGETAVFFEDIAELEEKLLWYAQHPEDAVRIALAGHAHAKRYHSASARARQLLARLVSLQRPQ